MLIVRKIQIGKRILEDVGRFRRGKRNDSQRGLRLRSRYEGSSRMRRD